MASAGCLLWLEALQPLFATMAAGALAYQGWLVGRRPPARRTRTMWAILAASVGVNAVVVVTWAALWLRYQ
ncbi:MAG TPA: hypothetical protein VMO26_03460 [Vicinamibacterales bacterium]|nr:hypothetical protein [Vicinamibacterales bacterium]